ncbi:hypothetical protein PSA7680_00170 [Pseudoruegeria aquimaris]|uniref:Lipoprotein n=1 Tax=Pseudoruegeria aquimaris TaxID=393663 RepID=A0A1Y5RAL6_9RHOB|nr:hypothetical protein [Pseudoruegeria aquimaris]SLN11842.1 hypothetical protein PSA7680_00170 [Pseudoruegeria aquimaris]
MKPAGIALLAATLLLSACSSSANLNPFSWFRSGDTEAVTVTTDDGVLVIKDPRVLVDQITAMRVDDTAGGVIVTATGLPPTQGYFKADLFALNEGKPQDGVITLEFRVLEPLTPQPVSIERSREITTATFLSDQTLRGAREIRVVGARNSRSARP